MKPSVLKFGLNYPFMEENSLGPTNKLFLYWRDLSVFLAQAPGPLII
jgi:hypothetical protein